MAKPGPKPTDPTTRPLTPQQERFVDEYMVCLNGTKAALAAGYSKDTARTQASALIALPYIAIAIQQRFDERRLEYAGRAQKLMDTAYEIATSEKARDGDKLKAIEISAKFLGFGFDKVDHTIYNGGDKPTIAADATPHKAIEVYATLLN